jgi:formylglycine-generating enzyme required for sulfatase activity
MKFFIQIKNYYFIFLLICFINPSFSQDNSSVYIKVPYDTIRYDADSNIITNGCFNRWRNHSDLSFVELYTPAYEVDRSLSSKKEMKINYYKKHFPDPPLDLNECAYISPADAKFDNECKACRLPEPHSFKFYSDTLLCKNKYDPVSDYLMCLKLKKSEEDFYQPFYFKRTEVTNKEYREFVYWVIDSIARSAFIDKGDSRYFLHPEDKGNLVQNKKEKIDWLGDSTRVVLEFMYLPPEERFYRRREIDARKVNFVYSNSDCTKCFINVYPDTLAWVHNFTEDIRNRGLEPLANMYFWHIMYDDYPVVGISQRQALAFLAWKTKQKQDELNKKNSNYIVSYELPDETEWEIMATKNNSTLYNNEFEKLYDNDYYTNLILKDSPFRTIHKTIKENESESGTYEYQINFQKNIQLKSSSDLTAYLDPNTKLCLYNVGLRYKMSYRKDNGCNYPDAIQNAYKDPNGGCFMGGNVSEWMKETYKDNWLPVYTYHQNKLKKINSKYCRQILEMENFYNEANDTNGVLVRGGNWYDLSLSTISGKNFEGINKKVFVSPDSAYCTVGFRYVVKVYRKDETTLLKEQATTK